MKLLVDTNRLTDALCGEASILQAKSGFVARTRAAANQPLLAQLLRQPKVLLLFVDKETLGVYARHHAELRQKDAVQHQLTLLTRDKHFESLPQVGLWR